VRSALPDPDPTAASPYIITANSEQFYKLTVRYATKALKILLPPQVGESW